MKKRVLVTGGTGFLGQKLVQRLHEQGHEVTALGRDEGIGRQLREQGIRFVRTDIRDREAVADACRSQEIVYHVAAFSSPWGRFRDMYETNVSGTVHVIAGCDKHGIERLVHVSSPSIYFAFADAYGIREDAPLPERFANVYAQTKHLAELEVDKAHRQGLPTITLRPRALFGPGDNAILPRLIRANEQKYVPLIGGGKALIDLTYVDNVVDALVLCMDSPASTFGRAYNITNGEAVTLIDVLTDVFRRLDMPLRAKEVPYWQAYGAAWVLELLSRTVLGYREPILTRYSVGVLAKSQTLDITKARQELGYEPRVSIAQGIETFTAWWRAEHGR
ncbi:MULTISPECIES: NAD-dependent epimerase/dehydratase family protein [Brevibacillus]|jgi:nucleoside-diphosphate-sugar epimerase|uniref:3-beta hydroxysteroid dehydrogenase n=1 Tax=Brevibacillus parabrevis TaxID=54914 RepID=A0A4Y3PUH4_BREPA|nr:MULTISPECIES: SDR family NAD(P)-dependent oxidoreductase [Brevibacillus]MBU8714174.1 SDR family NAD(P)-dependent oxidoreductase [Brevibacillus parabrevis]RNB95085.1 SDR family NAD(P)-dependent oxidoreductase [Brevibacillus parabrevis]UED68044.1 SDR family NAD(P)-dependent oxidoreductase [Brevibacillus sp. HD3.3A]WDV94320.1 SDR family NAD(P)-dependent oxidoreductase [Brevibacillus parabrevis]GEB34091.1 3-beta hydroxysteroid dehydrogenase [Brevibacillus parabrevis]